MKSKNENPLIVLCHPYLFALKEGTKIKDNPMDYSLLLLQRCCAEVIRSPVPLASQHYLITDIFAQAVEEEMKQEKV